MINLIPPEGRRILRNEYLLRVASVYAFLLGTVCLVGAALLSPTFVLVSMELNSVSKDIDENVEVDTAYVEAERTIKEANALILELRTASSGPQFSDILKRANDASPEGIRFSSLHIESEKDRETLTLEGIADSRIALAKLKESIEHSPRFKSASLPLGDLARESDLEFVLKIDVNSDSL